MIDIPKYFNFYKTQKNLNLDNKYEIFTYFRLKYSSSFKPYYHCMPVYNSVTNSTKFKYCLFDVDGDKVFVMYKVIQMGGSQHINQIRILDTPISLHQNLKNEELVALELKKLPFIKFAFKSSIDVNYLSKDRDLSYYNDYYYHYELGEYTSSKFKSKHGINKMLKDPRVEIISTTNGVDLTELRDEWIKGMASNNSDVPSSSTKDFNRFALDDSGEILKIILKYDKQPISVQIFYLCKEFQFADCLYINHLGRTHSDDVDCNRLLKNLSDIQNYLACVELDKLGINYSYVAGCRPTEKRLLKHKQNITDGCLYYSIDDNEKVYDTSNILMTEPDPLQKAILF